MSRVLTIAGFVLFPGALFVVAAWPVVKRTGQRAWDALLFASEGRILLARSLQPVEPDLELQRACREARVLSTLAECQLIWEATQRVEAYRAFCRDGLAQALQVQDVDAVLAWTVTLEEWCR